MAKKCRHTGCEAFSRKLRSAEILNLEKFNLSKAQCREILHGTIRGLCPKHAAEELHDDFRVPKRALRAIEGNWDTHLADNFSDAYAYAQCSSCNRLLSDDRKDNTPDEVRDILAENKPLFFYDKLASNLLKNVPSMTYIHYSQLNYKWWVQVLLMASGRPAEWASDANYKLNALEQEAYQRLGFDRELEKDYPVQ